MVSILQRIVLRQLKTACLFLCGLLASSALAQDPEQFPQPPEIQPAVNFWTKVYTEVDTQSGFLHDSQNLSIIYQRLDLNRREIEQVRSRIRDDLRELARGKRTGLTRTQQAVLDLWPSDVSNETLRTAANNVRWQLGQSDRFLGGLRRSGAYRSHINQVIREKGLPIELGVLPHVESSFNPRAYSSVSAAGMWQFGRDTARRFMRVDHIVDERMDPYTAAGAAMSLLEYNYSVLGTWPLALTAYNHGAGGIARAVRQTGTTDIEKIIANYRGRAFGFASRNFYPQFLAVIHVENNAQQYFGDFRLDPAPIFREVVTDAFIDAEVFARSIGISLEQLEADNQALRPAIWEGNKRIPSGYTIKVREQAIDASNLLALIPDDFKFELQTPDVAYVVVGGDSLSVIARRFNTSVNRLVTLNQLRSRNRIAIGQRLLLPQDNISSQQLIAQASDEPPEDGEYTVRRGDTVSLIAARYGVTEAELLNVNGIQDRNRIYPGQQIRLPGFGPSGVQIAAIEASTSPSPPTQIQFADEIGEVEIPEITSAANESVSESEIESSVASSIESPVEISVEIAAESVSESAIEGVSEEESVVVAVADIDIDPPAIEEEIGEQIEEFAFADIEDPVHLALSGITGDILPPAAVLPDNQELEAPVTLEEENAVALDPALDVSESNEQLTEALSADPSDYTVASNNSVEIQASETLGHYADWLGIRAWDLRRLNNMAYRDPVIIGDRLTLDFSRVNIAEFELKRRDYHSTLQQEFFSNYRIQNVENYRVRPGDNVGNIARTRYSTPVWLLRQYNPGLDFNRIQIDQEIVFPILEQVN
ncbi:MAG: LysM peptidoglycan-binding domain-containing protein [Pseudomonadales bacterium]|nr:LysM peptidoglycan-binding domain-containing protein [Pseudomonadales bacterium]